MNTSLPDFAPGTLVDGRRIRTSRAKQQRKWVSDLLGRGRRLSSQTTSLLVPRVPPRRKVVPWQIWCTVHTYA